MDASKMTQERDDNNTQRRNRIAAHWNQDSFFEHLDGRSQPRKPLVVIWMTCLLQVNGHKSSELSLFFTVVVRRVPLPQTWSSIFVITGCAINQPLTDMDVVNPNFVVAALICTPDAKRIVTFEGTIHANVPLGLGPQWLDKSAYVSTRLVHHLVPTAVWDQAE